MNGPHVMCNGCAAVEVPLDAPFCETCSEQVLQQLTEHGDHHLDGQPRAGRVQIGPTDI